MMTDEGKEEGVYGENIGQGSVQDERGIREETVEAHPQPTGDASADPAGVDAASDVKLRGAEALESSEGDAEDDEARVRTGEDVG